MEKGHTPKRFGATAMSKRFISFAEFIEAILTQIKDEMDFSKYRPVGEILIDLGYMTRSQQKKVLMDMANESS